MKRVISAVLFGFIMVVLVSRIAVAQPASQASAGGAQQSVGAASNHGSMLSDGMGMGDGTLPTFPFSAKYGMLAMTYQRPA